MSDHKDGGEFVCRWLDMADLQRGFLDALAELSNLGTPPPSLEDYTKRYQQIKATGVKHVMVMEHVPSQRIVATASLLLDYKFTHSLKPAGHIEDVVVCKAYSGKGLGKRLMTSLQEIALTTFDCYKVLCSCTEDNVAFYEKCGLVRKEVTMMHYAH